MGMVDTTKDESATGLLASWMQLWRCWIKHDLQVQTCPGSS
jgi:hypothetical protein